MDFKFDDQEAPVVSQSPQFKFDAYETTVPSKPVPMDPLEAYEGTLTKEQILGDEKLFDMYVRQPMSVRFGLNNRNRWLMDEQYNKEMSDEELFETWQNYQRSFAGGQTVTTASEIAFMQNASDDDKLAVGRGYMLFDRMPNIFSEDTSWGEMFDGMGDYARAAIVDPTTVLGLGVGRAVGMTGTKASAQLIRQAAVTATKQALKKGATKEVAKAAGRSTARKAILSDFAKRSVVPMSIDLGVNVAADIGYQVARIEGQAQEDYSAAQTSISALGTLALPAMIAGFRGLKSLSTLKGAEKIGADRYVNVANKLRGQMTPEAVQKAVLDQVDMELIGKRFGDLVEDMVSDPKKYGNWDAGVKAGQSVADTLDGMDLGGEDLSLFSIINQGSASAPGLGTTLKEAGFVFVPRYPGDKQTNFIGDLIKNLPQEHIDRITTAFGSTKFKGITAEDLGNYYKARGSQLGTELQSLNLMKTARRQPTLADVKRKGGPLSEQQAPAKTTKERLLYIQSLWKRLVTSHPGTTGLNVKGWGITYGLNTMSDVVEGIITLQPRSALRALRRGYNTLNWLDTTDAAKEFFEIRPDVEKKIHQYIAAGIDADNAPKIYGMDPKDPLVKTAEGITGWAQKVTAVRLQDEITKQISFMSALDKAIYQKYGYGYNRFMERPDAYVRMFSPEFTEVMDSAVNRTLRETYSKPFSENSSGKGIVRHLAREVERMSNTPGIGMLIPFGQFFNNALATLGDFSGINLAYHFMKRGVGKGGSDVSIDLAEESSKELFAKTIVGMGLLFGYFAPKEAEKLQQGIRWNEEPTVTGGLKDTTYEAPYPYFSIMGRILAHKQLDGEVPTELRDEAFNLIIGQTTRELGQAGAGATEFIKTVLELSLEDIGGATMEAMGSIVSQIASGFTRPLDPINQMNMLINDSYENLDRRQGIRAINESLRYVDSIFPVSTTEERNYPTNVRGPQNIGNILGGERQAQTPSVVNRMLASAGKSPWNAVKWDGDYPKLKNRLDAIIEPILHQRALDVLAETKFFDLPLERQEKILGRMFEDAKRQAREVLSAGGSEGDELLYTLNQIYGYGAKERSRAMRRLGIDDLKIEDLAERPDGVEKLGILLDVLQNQDEYLDLD